MINKTNKITEIIDNRIRILFSIVNKFSVPNFLNRSINLKNIDGIEDFIVPLIDEIVFLLDLKKKITIEIKNKN